MTTPTAIIDLREMAPHTRAERVFRTFDGLRPGTLLELVAEREPVALRALFGANRAGQYEWQVVETGPAVWRVRVAKKDGRLA